MKIAAIEVYGYELSYAHGTYAMSGDRVAQTQDSTLVRVVTTDGVEGWGEISTLGGTYLPAYAGGARAAVAEFGPALIGVDATNLSAVNLAMNSVLIGYQYAKSAVDIACWDILGKATQMPIAALLGGVVQVDFPVYEAVPLASPEAMAAFVRDRRAAGINQFQLKVGNAPKDDVARVQAVVSAAASDTLIIADANGGWSLSDAVIAANSLADLPIYLEQPCRTSRDCIALRPHVRLPLVMDESIVYPEDLVEAKQEAGAGSVNLKLSRVGGLSGASFMRDLAVRIGMSVSLEDQWGGDVTTAAVSHLAASTMPGHLLSTSFFNDWTNEHVAGYQPRSVRGRGSAPTGPGLGITVDIASLGVPLLQIS